MKYIIIFAAFIVIASAQFPPGFLDIPGVTPPPWQGPLANHINGIPPQDTPEVSAAKAALNRAYAEVLAVLPELPPEERYRTNPTQNNVPIQHHGQHLVHHNIVPQPDYTVLHHGNPTPAPVIPTIKTFAEDVPRSPLGEVPEVHAARVAHLKAYQDAVATLPRLADTRQQPISQHVQHPGFVF